jgi:hypothetical protein
VQAFNNFASTIIDGDVMNKFFGFFAAAIALMGVLTAPAKAEGLPLVVSATVDYNHKTLTISGKHFGKSPIVTLDAITFQTSSSAGNQVVAKFPSDKAPSSFLPGTYFLTLVFKNQLPAIFAVDIGANGPTGPEGPTGAPGKTGSQGTEGIPGIPGPTGPIGLTGASGSRGPAGPEGATGARGPGVDPAILQQIATLQAQLDALRKAVAVSPNGTNVQVEAAVNLNVIAGASKSETIGASNTENIGASSTESIGGSRTIDIGVDDELSVANDQNVSVGRDQTVTVTGGQKVSVSADLLTQVGGNIIDASGKSIQFLGPKGAKVLLNNDGSITISTTTGDIQMLSGANILIKATGDVRVLGQRITNN